MMRCGVLRRLVGRGPACAAWLLAMAASLACHAQLNEQDARLVEGLRRRRVFSLAEQFCREQQAAPSQSAWRADWTVELMKTLAARAAEAPVAQRDAAWDAVHREAEQFLVADREHPRRWLVRYQDALSRQARAELLRYEIGDLQAGPERDQAMATLRTASAAWTDLIRELQDALAEARSSGAEGEGLSSDELTALQNSAAYQTARVSLFRAASYAAGTADRTAALQQAVQNLQQVRIALADNDPLMWDVMADLLSCHRRLNQWTEAEQIYRLSDPARAPAAPTARLRGEAMRLLIDQGKPQAALSLRRPEDDEQPSPELDLALLETLLALWKEADREGRRGETARLKQRVEQTADWMEQQYGPLWRRRADALLLRAAPEDAVAGQWKIIQRQASDLAGRNEIDQAVDLLDKSLRSAPPRDPNAALALAYQAAALVRAQGRNGEFLERLRDLAVRHRAADKAPEAHAQAIAVSVALARTDPALAGLYVELLDEHLATFPEAETANQARLWKSRQLAHEGDAPAALDLLLRVAPRSAWAVEAAREYGLLSLRNPPDANAATPTAAMQQAARQAQAASSPSAASAWTAWSVLLRVAAGEAGYASLRDELTATAADPATPDARLASAALRALSGDAVQAVGELSNIDDANLLEALNEVLVRAAERGTADRRRAAGEMLLLTLQLPPLQQSPAAGSGIAAALLRGQALRWAGRDREALQWHRQLAAEQPRNLQLQQAFGELLLESPDREDQQAALEHWRGLAARTRLGGEDWYRAKFGVAQASFLLGDRAGAARLIQYVAAATGWRDCPNREAFEALLRKTGE